MEKPPCIFFLSYVLISLFVTLGYLDKINPVPYAETGLGKTNKIQG
jgi:hypothetical protein